MSPKSLRKFLLYCTIINYFVLLLWFGIMMLPHAWIYQLSGAKMSVTPEAFDEFNFAGIILYKLAIVMFNLVPCVALYMVKEQGT